MVAIICAGQIELSPFAKKYITVLEKNSISYDIIHWNRSGDEPSPSNNVYTFTESLQRYTGLLFKALPMLHFRHFVKKIIKKKNYQKLIMLTTQTAFLFPDLLFGRYRKSYFFDYRDTSYEYIKLYQWYIRRIAKNSFAVSISSPGFEQYVAGSKNIVLAHNFQDDYYKDRKLACVKKPAGQRIVMGYIGVLREYDYLIRLISFFGNDARFEFHIHGGGDDLGKLSEFSKQFSNIFVFGAYDEKDKGIIIDSFDMICYHYPYSFVNYPALANKFYDGLIMKKPMFGNPQTYSGKLIETLGLGICLGEHDPDTGNKIYEYYQSFSAEQFTVNCEKYLIKVQEDDKKYLAEIEKFVKSEGDCCS